MYQKLYPYLPHCCLPGNRDIPDVQDYQVSHKSIALQGWFPHRSPNPQRY